MKPTPITPLQPGKRPNYYQPDYRQPSIWEEEVFVPLGTAVKLNHFTGKITAIHTHIHSIDARNDAEHWVPLRFPLYEVEVKTDSKVSWAHHARQVFCPEGTTRLRLFRDEFELLIE
jgi:hypothetical protein